MGFDYAWPLESSYRDFEQSKNIATLLFQLIR